MARPIDREEREHVDLVNARARKTVGRPIASVPRADGDVGAERGPIPAPEPFAAKRILEGEAPMPPAMLIDRLLLGRDVNILGGPGGVGKTLVLLMLAASVALGLPAFGSLAVQWSGPVLLVCPEDGEAFVRMALEAICAGLELDDAQRAQLRDRLTMIADDELVNLSTDVNRLKHTVLAAGAVLLVLDPLRNLLPGGEEMNNDLAGQVLDQVRRAICREANCTVAISHHHRKRSRDQDTEAASTIEDLRGASGWGNGARMVYVVSKSDASNVIRLTCVKANRLRAADLRHELTLAIVASPGNAAHWTSVTLADANAGIDSVAYTPGLARPLTTNEKAALSALDDAQEPGMRFSWSQWVASSGLAKDTFRNVKDRLLKAGLATAVATGKRTRGGGAGYVYCVSDLGRTFLAGHRIGAET